MELGKHHCTASRELTGDRQAIPNPFPCVSCTFPSFHFPLYSMRCLISLLFLKVGHHRRMWTLSPRNRIQQTRTSCDIESARQVPRARVKTLGPIIGTLLVSHLPSLHCLLYNRITAPNASDHPGVLWSLGMCPCGRKVCVCMWEGRTNAFLSNYINGDPRNHRTLHGRH